ncbi:hypothetical protein GGI12_001104 [Dipsacomyces acuminosporus]|nr:hypothetical protein GGI12_001104 [Dipsacomyces acuminosporus]
MGMNIFARAAGLLPLLVAAWCFSHALKWTRLFSTTGDEIKPGEESHKLTWRHPMKYDIAAYATDAASYYSDRENFFKTAQKVLQINNLDINQKYPRFTKSIRVQLPEHVRQSNSTAMYLHMFAQKAGQMNPHPLMRDQYMVFAHTKLVMPRMRAGSDSAAAVPHGLTKVVWEMVLENHQFAMWQIPMDLSRLVDLVYLNPQERRAYNPISWENPLIGSVATHRWVPLTSKSVVSKSVPLEAEYIDVDVDISGVTLGWLRASLYLNADTNTGGIKNTPASSGPLRKVIKLAAVQSLDLGPLASYALILMAVLRVAADAWSRKCSLEASVQKLAAKQRGSPVSLAGMLLSFAASAVALLHPLAGIDILDSSLRCIRMAWFAIEATKLLALLLAPKHRNEMPSACDILLLLAVSLLTLVLIVQRTTGIDALASKAAMDTYAAEALLVSASALAQIRTNSKSAELGMALALTPYVYMLAAALCDAVLLLCIVPLHKILPARGPSHGPSLLDLMRAYWPLLPAACLIAYVYQTKRHKASSANHSQKSK